MMDSVREATTLLESIGALGIGLLMFVAVPAAISLTVAIWAAHQEPEPISDQLLSMDIDDWHTWFFLTGYLMPMVCICSFIIRALGGGRSTDE